MAVHNTLGEKGEDMAVAYLQALGYTVLHRNWRHSYYEIDIIATKNNKLHFVEVKIRSSKKYGWPEDAVTKKKFKALLHAADEFLHQHPQYKHVQYDVLSINCSKGQTEPQYFLLQDVYL